MMQVNKGVEMKFMVRGPFPQSEWERDVANNWVLVISMELFTSSDMKHQRKILYSLSQSLSVNGLLE